MNTVVVSFHQSPPDVSFYCLHQLVERNLSISNTRMLWTYM